MRLLTVLGSVLTIALLVAGEVVAPGWRASQNVAFEHYGEIVLVLLYLAMALLVAWKATPSRDARLIVAFLLALALARGFYGVGAAASRAELFNVAGALAVDVIMLVAFLFPALYPPRHTKQSAWILRIGIVFCALMIAAWMAESIAGTRAASIADDVATFPFFLVVIAAVVDGTIAGGSSYRVPSLVAGSTIVLLVLINVASATMHLLHGNTGWVRELAWLRYASGIGMTYAVLRHRLLDLHVVISRAAIFSAFSLCLIALFALAEWALIVILERAVGPRFNSVDETALTALVALGVGVSARSIHHTIEHRLNRVFFARRYRALAELHRYALETDATTDADALVTLTVTMLRRNLETSTVGLYAGCSDTGYALLLGDATLPPHLETDDEIVLRLRRWGEPLLVDNEEHSFSGSLVCPMILRRQLYGFVVCGRKRDRTSYLPDERETIASLVHRVGIAYEWLTRESTMLRPAQVLS